MIVLRSVGGACAILGILALDLVSKCYGCLFNLMLIIASFHRLLLPEA